MAVQMDFQDPKYETCFKLIFARLPVVELYKHRKVCKYWRSIIDNHWENAISMDCHGSWTKPKTNKISVLNLSQLEVILKRCVKLRRFDFSGNSGVAFRSIAFEANKRFFAALVDNCPYLEMIDISILTPTLDGISYLANKCKTIVDFRINDSANKCDTAMISFFKNSKNLKSITLHKYRQEDTCLGYLPVETIKEIHLQSLHDQTVEQLVYVLENCENLQALTINEICLKEKKLTEVTEKLRRHAHSLERLTLSEDKFPLDPTHFSGLENLSFLKLNAKKQLNNRLLESLGQDSGNLKFVSITSDKVTDRGMLALPDIEHIELKGLSLVKGEFLARMSTLKTIHLIYCGINDRYLHLMLDTAVNLQCLVLRSPNYFDIKEFVLHAIDVAKERKQSTKIPLEIVLDVGHRIKELKQDLLHIRNFDLLSNF